MLQCGALSAAEQHFRILFDSPFTVVVETAIDRRLLQLSVLLLLQLTAVTVAAAAVVNFIFSVVIFRRRLCLRLLLLPVNE